VRAQKLPELQRRVHGAQSHSKRSSRLYPPWSVIEAAPREAELLLIAAHSDEIDETRVETRHHVKIPPWYEYHVQLGEVHCGTNILRTATSARWWEYIQ
jgi:hypothetical protein